MTSVNGFGLAKKKPPQPDRKSGKGNENGSFSSLRHRSEMMQVPHD
jgi:hypothetical protein